MNHLVITAVGQDRPGIVDELSSLLLEKDLNIEDSRMSILGGEFAILLLISGAESTLQELIGNQQRLEQATGLQLVLKPTGARQAKEGFVPYDIQVVAMDHPGIVHRLTRYLAQQACNIESLETRSYHAPHTGTPMFAVKMLINIPASASLASLKDGFIALCEQENLDAEFKPVTSDLES